MKRPRLIALASILALPLAFAETSVADTPTPASGTTWAPNQKVPFRWKEGAVPPSWLRPAILDAAEDSNQSRGARAASFSRDRDAVSWIAYTNDIPTTYAVGYAVRRVPDSFNIRLRPHGHVLDWGTLKWCQYWASSPPNGCYDAELITLHEFGHVQTLGHVDESLGEPWPDSIMHAGPRTKAKIGWNAHEFGRCDVARLQIRYRTIDSYTPYSTCLSLPTDLSLAASSTSVTAGTSVTFTAMLNVSHDAVHAKLQGAALSGRAVELQRRQPGASSWTSHAHMLGTSTVGRYNLTLQPSATYEWRAVFAKPTDEGLRAANSSVTTVTVGNCVDGVCCTGPVCATSMTDGPHEQTAEGGQG